MSSRSFLALGLMVLASTVSATDLKDCYKDALKQSETLVQRQEDVVQAEEHYRQALGAVMPSLGLGYTYTRLDDHAYYPTMDPSNPRDQNTLKATLAQPLFRGFREFQALDQVKDTLAAAKDARRWAGMQLYEDVAQAYFLVLSLQRSRDLVREQVKTYDDRIQELKDFQSIGRSRASDVLTVQAAQSLLSATAVAQDAQIHSARQLLAFLTGQDPDRALDPAADQPKAAGDLASLLEAAAKRPDLHAATLRLDAAHQSVSIANGAHWPSADLLGNWYFNRPPGSNSNINWDLSFVATLPLFQGFATVSKAAEAASIERQARKDLERQKRQVESDLRTQFGVLTGDLAQVAALEQASDLSDKSYQALKRDYSRGLCTNLDVLQALNSSRDAQRALETARYAARNDYERLQALAGLAPEMNMNGDADDAR